ncbi:hypothetical protein AB9P05_24350 [Roseivirga sp. BDSF3-8]|uniref:hypothetical protein n=1 Tax=Roseivirga sp. BDSF3-8 TaxID=3241598 RepID=UPI003532482F
MAEGQFKLLDIKRSSGKLICKFYKGNYLEIISKRKIFGGNIIYLDPTKTTTITGNLDQVGIVKQRGLALPGLTSRGPNPRAINSLFSPKWGLIQQKYISLLNAGQETAYWKKVTDEFWEDVNKPWLEGAIRRNDNIRLVSNPNDDLAVYVTKRGTNEFVLDLSGNKIKSIFGREVDLLRSEGYIIDESGLALK